MKEVDERDYFSSHCRRQYGVLIEFDHFHACRNTPTTKLGVTRAAPIDPRGHYDVTKPNGSSCFQPPPTPLHPPATTLQSPSSLPTPPPRPRVIHYASPISRTASIEPARGCEASIPTSPFSCILFSRIPRTARFFFRSGPTVYCIWSSGFQSEMNNSKTMIFSREHGISLVTVVVIYYTST